MPLAAMSSAMGTIPHAATKPTPSASQRTATGSPHSSLSKSSFDVEIASRPSTTLARTASPAVPTRLARPSSVPNLHRQRTGTDDAQSALRGALAPALPPALEQTLPSAIRDALLQILQDHQPAAPQSTLDRFKQLVAAHKTDLVIGCAVGALALEVMMAINTYSVESNTAKMAQSLKAALDAMAQMVNQTAAAT